MDPAPKAKLGKDLGRNELAAFLRQLADEAQQGALSFPGGPVGLSGMKALKITIKDAGPGLRAKVRIKFPKPDTPDASRGGRRPALQASPVRPRYNSLKKRMKRNFKDIGAALAAGFAPKSELVATFVADSRLMTTYRGKGDEAYPAYLEAVSAFAAAAAAGDVEAMVPAYRELAAGKKRCHARYA
ncbi:MAG: GAK system XXXCH domain-containing protein [Desulfovibrio sp.]|nr:GAK system XXXCH domain-containing protein [Desulfovibrio sp.]